MPNHFHNVWIINESLGRSDFQRNILKFTGHTILMGLKLEEERFTNILRPDFVKQGKMSLDFWKTLWKH